jgi:enterochelin esterase family protein
MLIEPDPDSNYRRVTFSWAETDDERPALDVLLRLITLADNAHDDGDLAPYLLDRDHDGVWHTSLRLPSDLRSSYQFCIVRDRSLRGDHPDNERFRDLLAMGVTDPSNPATIGPSTFPNLDPASVLEMPDAPAQPWHARRSGVPAGEITALNGPGEPSTVWIYTPHCYDNSREPLPLAVLFDARVWMRIDVASTFDNLIAAGAIPPTVAVLIDSINGTTRVESLARPEVFMPFLLDELMPHVGARWRVTSKPGSTVLVGQSLGGLAAAYAGLQAPHRFGLLLSQSGSFWWPGDSPGEIDADALIGAYANTPRRPVRLFQEAGLLERDLLASNRRLHKVLRGRGYDVVYREYQGGHDYACWRGGLADGLIALLAQPPRREASAVGIGGSRGR